MGKNGWIDNRNETYHVWSRACLVLLFEATAFLGPQVELTDGGWVLMRAMIITLQDTHVFTMLVTLILVSLLWRDSLAWLMIVAHLVVSVIWIGTTVVDRPTELLSDSKTSLGAHVGQGCVLVAYSLSLVFRDCLLTWVWMHGVALVLLALMHVRRSERSGPTQLLLCLVIYCRLIHQLSLLLHSRQGLLWFIIDTWSITPWAWARIWDCVHHGLLEGRCWTREWAWFHHWIDWNILSVTSTCESMSILSVIWVLVSTWLDGL